MVVQELEENKIVVPEQEETEKTMGPLDYLNEKINGKGILDGVIKYLLEYYETEAKPKGIDEESFKKIIDYKRAQINNLIGDRTDYAFRDVMRLLSCPLDIDSADKIDNFGIRIPSKESYELGVTSNGVINSYLSYCILNSALDGELYIHENGTKLITKDDMLTNYSTYLLPNTDLLLYLFLTGRGDEFNNLYKKTEGEDALNFLSKLESGRFTQEEIEKRIEKTKEKQSSINDTFDADYRRLFTEDLKIIKEKLEQHKMVEDIPSYSLK